MIQLQTWNTAAAIDNSEIDLRLKPVGFYAQLTEMLCLSVTLSEMQNIILVNPICLLVALLQLKIIWTYVFALSFLICATS